MSWAVGFRDGRWMGYGVPAICDFPDCGASIDRGISFACGGGPTGVVEGCSNFFCSEHLPHFKEEDDPNGGGEWVCERCANDQPAFDPTTDTVEWVTHMLEDESWQRWRDENADELPAMRERVSA